MAVNNSKRNITVQKVELNGKNVDLSHPFVKHSGIKKQRFPSFIMIGTINFWLFRTDLWRKPGLLDERMIDCVIFMCIKTVL